GTRCTSNRVLASSGTSPTLMNSIPNFARSEATITSKGRIIVIPIPTAAVNGDDQRLGLPHQGDPVDVRGHSAGVLSGTVSTKVPATNSARLGRSHAKTRVNFFPVCHFVYHRGRRTALSSGRRADSNPGPPVYKRRQCRGVSWSPRFGFRTRG